MNIVQQVEADFSVALADVKKGLTYLKTEGEIIIAWVEKEVPGSVGAIAAFLVEAEKDAGTLAQIAATGLSGQITAGADSMETFLLNLVQSLGLATNASGTIEALDVAGVSTVQTIAQGLVSTGLANLLSKLAPKPVVISSAATETPAPIQGAA